MFPQLHNLRIVINDSRDNSQARKQATAMVARQAAGLHSLTLVNVIHYSRVWKVLHAVAIHPSRLRVLTLRNVTFFLDHWNPDHRELFSRLEALRLDNSLLWFRQDFAEGVPDAHFFAPIEEEGSVEDSLVKRGQYWKPLPDIKIQHLSMNNPYVTKEQYLFLLDCRELRSLQWVKEQAGERGNIKPALAKWLREGQWPFLERLEIVMTQFSDQELAEILEAMPRPLKTLRMDKTAFAEASTRALLESGEGHHRKSLESLSLVGCADLQGSMVQQFLCEMPRLRKLHARVLTDQDMAKDPRPWVCQNMRYLQVGFVYQLLSENSAEQPVEVASEGQLPRSALFDRLAGLSNLHTLGFMNSQPVEERTGAQRKHTTRPDFHKLLIQNGLDVLKSLTGLQFLLFGETDQDLTSEEAQWMVDHWPRLRVVAVSRASNNKETKIQLRAFFQSHGINST
ncbi:hypothetical protein EMPS_03877 [Entomortierella parvispora]|uniref:Uncharacterized protein n=1 Tax=Entomortierella parvispora TaxID=205924 RepID=A0A9P3LV04_9FUNG|nr:hypothetical protein EMPS_03877 [Entomortierella parvispora]